MELSRSTGILRNFSELPKRPSKKIRELSKRPGNFREVQRTSEKRSKIPRDLANFRIILITYLQKVQETFSKVNETLQVQKTFEQFMELKRNLSNFREGLRILVNFRKLSRSPGIVRKVHTTSKKPRKVLRCLRKFQEV